MASLLESLPCELLDAICDHISPDPSESLGEDVLVSTACNHFPYIHLARLTRTSKSLRFHVEPLLYESDTARTVALYRAIREGNLDAIAKAISYGASPTILEIRGNPLDEVVNGTSCRWRVSTLHLALKFQQTAAFEVLVKHGADVNHAAWWEQTDSHESQKIVQRLCKPRNEESLRLVLRAAATPGDGDQLGDKPPTIRHLPLVSIVGWASSDLLHLLLGKHADPNELHPGLGYRLLSPLSAAILIGSPESFKLLVSHGADVNGRDVPRDQPPMHIPVIAAATQILQGPSGLAMMQLCLDHGANIGRPCHENDFPISFKNSREDDSIPHVCTTALLTFLGSIKSWDPSPSTMHPVDGLKLILNAGASAVSPPSRQIERRHNNTHQFLHDRTYGGASSALEVLLDKWGLEHLAKPEFFEVLELLISHGAARPFFARILVKYDSVKNPEWARPEIMDHWRRLLDLLIADMKECSVNIDAMLRRVIADKGKLRKTISHTPWRGVGEIGRASVDALIAAGADINARTESIDVPPRQTTSYLRDTALQEVCAALIHTDGLHDEFHDHADGHLCEYSLMNETTFSEWFGFLISRGADPYVEDTHKHREGESAVSIMVSPMKEGRAWMDGHGSLEKHLMRLVAVLKGTSESLVYDGERERYEVEDLAWLFSTRQRGRNASGKQCLAC